MRTGHLAILLTTLVLGVVLPQAAQARAWRVEQDGSGEFATIQPAVDAAASGDTILIGPGQYQEMQDIQPIGDNYTTQVVVYSPPDKALTYIGAGSDRVTIGPDVFDESWFGPRGIFHEGNKPIFIRGICFQNLFTGVNSYYDLDIYECKFVSNKVGIYIPGVSEYRKANIIDCVFMMDQLLGGGIMAWGGGEVLVDGCMFNESDFCFNGIPSTLVRNCEFTGMAGQYVYTNGEFIKNSVVNTSFYYYSLNIQDGSSVLVKSNEINGGNSCVYVSGPGTNAILEDNILFGGSEATIRCSAQGSLIGQKNHILPSFGQYTVRVVSYGEYYPATIDLRNNYWGTDDPDQVAEWIWDGNDDPDVQMIVDYLPISDGPMPNEDASWGDVKAMYRGLK